MQPRKKFGNGPIPTPYEREREARDRGYLAARDTVVLAMAAASLAYAVVAIPIYLITGVQPVPLFIVFCMIGLVYAVRKHWEGQD